VTADGAQVVGSHAPLARQLAELVHPDLDDVVFEEGWPALDRFSFDRGPTPAFAFVDRLGFRVGVRDELELAVLTEELRVAIAEPHFLDAYLDGARFRHALRARGSRYEVEAVVAALNQLLALRGSGQRLLLLAADAGTSVHRVLGGPRSRLLEAIDAGAAPPAEIPVATDRRRSRIPAGTRTSDPSETGEGK
jgi:hypothetical protein